MKVAKVVYLGLATSYSVARYCFLDSDSSILGKYLWALVRM